MDASTAHVPGEAKQLVEGHVSSSRLSGTGKARFLAQNLELLPTLWHCPHYTADRYVDKLEGWILHVRKCDSGGHGGDQCFFQGQGVRREESVGASWENRTCPAQPPAQLPTLL
jgi:hypothetical protein